MSSEKRSTKTKPTCENCACWHQKDDQDVTGLCRRYPPVPVVRLNAEPGGKPDFITQGWPETWRGAWCAEWRRR